MKSKTRYRYLKPDEKIRKNDEFDNGDGWVGFNAKATGRKPNEWFRCPSYLVPEVRRPLKSSHHSRKEKTSGESTRPSRVKQRKSVCTRRELARKIAKELFTNGKGEWAHALRLSGPNDKYLGGWCHSACVAQIEAVLKKEKK